MQNEKGYNHNGKKKDNNSGNERVATTTLDFFVVCDMDVINLACHDSCSSRNDYFVSYTFGDYGVVRMGNDGVANIVGKRDVCLETPNGS